MVIKILKLNIFNIIDFYGINIITIPINPKNNT